MSGLACSFPYRARRLSSRPSSRASSPSSISSEYRTALSSPIQSDCEVIGNRLALISSDSFLLCGENYTSMWLDWHNTQILRIIMILPQLTSVDEETCLEFKLNLPPIYQASALPSIPWVNIVFLLTLTFAAAAGVHANAPCWLHAELEVLPSLLPIRGSRSYSFLLDYWRSFSPKSKFGSR